MPQIEVSEETYEKIKDQLIEEEKIDISSYDDLIGKTHTIDSRITSGYFNIE